MTSGERPRYIARTFTGLAGATFLASAASTAEIGLFNVFQIPQPHPFESFNMPINPGVDVFCGLWTLAGGVIGSAYLHHALTSNKKLPWM